MQIFICALILTILFASPAFGQDPARRQKLDEIKQISAQLKLLREERKQVVLQQAEALFALKAVSADDAAEAARLGAKAIRLFPCCALNEKVREMDELGGISSDIPFEVRAKLNAYDFSSYLITDLVPHKDRENMFEMGSSTFRYRSDSIDVTRSNSGNHGFIADLGKTAFENLDERTREIAALAEYRPPADEKNIRDEFVSNGLFFRRSVPVDAGHVYLLRAVKYGDNIPGVDGIFALKAHRLDKNGSLILFIKTIKIFDPPRLRNPEREEAERVFNLGLLAKLKEKFAARGFDDVQLETAGKTVVLKGFVPFGKIPEAVEIAKNITDGITVKSELAEK